MRRLILAGEPLRRAILVSLGLTGCSGKVDSTSEGPPALPRCENDQALVDDGIATGLFACANGVVHRPLSVACEAGTPSQETEGLPPPDPGWAFPCQVDVDCTEKAYGMCRGEPIGGTFCEYGCLSNSDCQANQVCVCGNPYGVCTAAQCTTDTDCPGEALCALSLSTEPVCEGVSMFVCQSLADECIDSRDCNDGEYWPNYCSVETGVRACHEPSGAVCGRPFIVLGSQRQAEATSCTEWRTRQELAPGTVNGSIRTRLAKTWTRLGLMEHASIAAFARFSLQLMQLGAPADLVEASTLAMQDETRHARLCFELASRYAGHAVGPGPLDTSGALESVGLVNIVLLTIEEGCIGETVAALEAAELAAHSGDEVVRTVLETIRRDELSHSALAWRFVSWALGQGDSSLRAAVQTAFQRLCAETDAPVPIQLTALDETLLAHGVATDAISRLARVKALREVVLPCAEALLATNQHSCPSSGVNGVWDSTSRGKETERLKVGARFLI